MITSQKPFRGMQINKTHPLSRGLVGCWIMNEGTGDIVFDLSGNENHGINNGAEWAPDGLNFDGSADYIDVGNNKNLNVTNITISAWSKTVVDDGYWVTKNYSSLLTPYTLTLRSSSAYEGFSFYDGSFHKTGITPSGTAKLIDGAWHYVVGTYNGLVLKFYIDGVIDSSLEYTGALPVNTNDVLIGAAINNNEYFFNGDISTVSIYNRALSIDEIKLLYKEPYAMFKPSFNPGILYAAAAAAGVPNPGAMMMAIMM